MQLLGKTGGALLTTLQPVTALLQQMALIAAASTRRAQVFRPFPKLRRFGSRVEGKQQVGGAARSRSSLLVKDGDYDTPVFSYSPRCW